MPVTTQMAEAATKLDTSFIDINAKYTNLTTIELKQLNDQLTAAGLGKISF